MVGLAIAGITPGWLAYIAAWDIIIFAIWLLVWLINALMGLRTKA